MERGRTSADIDVNSVMDLAMTVSGLPCSAGYLAMMGLLFIGRR